MLGKHVYRKVPGVRIPSSPLVFKDKAAFFNAAFFIGYLLRCNIGVTNYTLLRLENKKLLRGTQQLKEKIILNNLGKNDCSIQIWRKLISICSSKESIHMNITSCNLQSYFG
tara:strand:+ start:14447 stop:14782 length:336 start_codon:yes stop_codon:yes gene_type:complete